MLRVLQSAMQHARPITSLTCHDGLDNVAAAGVAHIYPFVPTHEVTEEGFDRVFSLNVKVPYFLVAESSTNG